ncbi:sulfotransferase domain-containing protein [Parafilimonas sp.]|uniref:sulfotransferase domain-containing protein n=1 Tax=Parafilimonas sp. TaxID=1969739 RepID=UPI0039E65E74
MNEKHRQKQAPFPNAFLAGVQKAGTTTLNGWISQHPQVYCYNSLKDIPLFVKFPQPEQLNKRLLLETPAYNKEPVVFHSAVNYIFYPSLLQQIALKQPAAKLIVILRNPVTRAISSYFYFRKMMREKRDMETALIYQPQKKFEITRDNNDFTYIEHGFYYEQVKNCLRCFPKAQLLVLDYDDLENNPGKLLQEVFHFLNIDEKFKPSLIAKNITGELKSRYLQQRLVKKSGFHKWIVDNLIDPWLPVNKRKLLKNKMFELNTSRSGKQAAPVWAEEETIKKIQEKLTGLYLHDTANLDELLHTDFFSKWFAHDIVPKE